MVDSLWYQSRPKIILKKSIIAFKKNFVVFFLRCQEKEKHPNPVQPAPKNPNFSLKMATLRTPKKTHRSYTTSNPSNEPPHRLHHLSNPPGSRWLRLVPLVGWLLKWLVVVVVVVRMSWTFSWMLRVEELQIIGDTKWSSGFLASNRHDFVGYYFKIH